MNPFCIEVYMKKTLLLLAGYPGTGKSYLCEQILEKWSACIVSQDEIKEALWDDVGFDDELGKEATTQQSRELYYQCIEKKMQEGINIISDYPFSDKQKPIFEKWAKQYGYQVLTIRLIADLDILFERQKQRDLSVKRHLGHMMTHYHKGDILEDRSKADLLLDYDEFINRCTVRGYGEFQLGKLIEVDVSDFSKVGYEDILKEVIQYVN